jgi:hypothetical protein
MCFLLSVHVKSRVATERYDKNAFVMRLPTPAARLRAISISIRGGRDDFMIPLPHQAHVATGRHLSIAPTRDLDEPG